MLNLFNKIVMSSVKLGGLKIFIVFLLILFSTAIELVGISLIIPIVNIFLDPSNIDKYKIFLNLQDIENSNFLKIILAIFILIFLFKYIITICFEYLTVKYSKAWERKLIYKLINIHLQRPWLETLKTKESLLKNIVTDIPVYIQQGLTGVLNIYKSVLILSGMLLYIVYEKGLFTVVIFLFFFIIFYIFFKAFKNYLTGLSIKYSDFIKIKYDLTEEISSGLREIKIYNLKKYFLSQFNNNEKLIAKIDIVRKFTSIIPKILVEFVLISSFLTVIYFNIDNPQKIIPFLGLLAFIIYRSQPLLSSLGSLVASLQIHRVQIEAAIQIINQDQKKPLKTVEVKTKPIHINHNSILKFRELSFSYSNNPNDKKIFSNLNLNLQFGNIYGLAGKNGSGKSTFADLMIGLIKPQIGDISLDGTNIDVYQNNWSNSIAYLSQNYFLFDDTIKNNITLESKQNKDFDKAIYERSIKFSNLIGELSKFENKDETFLKNSGQNLSGGQKQRIAIARLIYKNSKIIILDEPTSSLDQISSEITIKMLKEIKKDKLIIVISHSKEILNECDKILTINNGNLN